ncbi:uncharacterized protein A4U43_C05F16690 [Asparagus officinalis]|uniref:Uncharacterized protein n=1 Tax=Asparagus officinalis TaxID=4686 RepID=A0A5P1EXH5_ASPOF|nr:ubiquitin carboxyl-terminal hydrolase 8-like [Asparagus officinalis]ONK68850.1 uncharacterized protein A4U43_C05F16660 [Asparagus officinalis]ONK68852.1 uncharacterized protein A4U43_C05F16690 [Asparagus officinalis]
MSITVFSGDTSGPVLYTVNLPEDGNCKDLIQALGYTCFLKDNETLYVVKVYADQVLHLDDTLAISLIRDCDRVIAYRLLTDEADLPLLTFVHRRLE